MSTNVVLFCWNVFPTVWLLSSVIYVNWKYVFNLYTLSSCRILRVFPVPWNNCPYYKWRLIFGDRIETPIIVRTGNCFTRFTNPQRETNVFISNYCESLYTGNEVSCEQVSSAHVSSFMRGSGVGSGDCWHVWYGVVNYFYVSLIICVSCETV